jgi:ribosome-binding protein aMBF1 (putative translation factor)
MKRNHTGHRVGECHQKARLSDAQVRNVRAARERLGWSYREIGEFFGVSLWTVRDICTYRTRGSA